jgi:O-antigen/teichoic acid export membrane protein
LRPAFERSVAWPLLRHTLPYALAVAVNIAYFRLALIVTSLVAPGTQTGYFAASFRIVEVIIVLPPVILAAALPILARAARDDAARFAYATQRVCEVALIAGVLAAVGLELGARIAIDVLAGASYAPAVPILRIQTPAIAATFVAVSCAYPLLALRRYREVLIANAAALGVSGILLALLVPPFEATGAAVATLAAEVTLAGMMAALLLRARPDVELAVRLVPWVVLAGAGGLAAGLLPGLSDLASVAVGASVYCTVLAVSGRVPRELFDAVRRR